MLNHAKMIVTCPECATRYQIDASKFPEEGRDVKCTTCAHKWFQRHEDLTPAEIFDVDSPLQNKAEFSKSNPENKVNSYKEEVDAPSQSTQKEAPVSIEQEASRLMKRAKVARSHARREKADHKANAKKIMLLTSALIILGGLGIKYRTEIVKKVPQTAIIYEKIGLPVNVRGLEFKKVEAIRDFQDGIPILAIKGEILNITDKAQSTAPLRYALYNKDNEEVYHWTVPVQTKLIGSKARLPIAARLAAPPPEASKLEVRFMRK